MKKYSLIPILLCICLLFSACTDNGSVWPFGKDEIPKTSMEYRLNLVKPNAYSSIKGLSLEPGSCISIIGRYSGDSYWDELEDGAKKAVEDLNDLLGYKGSDKIKLSFCAPNIYNDVNEQINLLDEELDRAPVALAIATIDSSACFVQFDLAAENSIPIVTFDTANNYKDIAAHISTNNIYAAKTAATQLATMMEGTGEIIIFAQDSVSQISADRVKGFMDTISADYPDISIVKVYYLDQLVNNNSESRINTSALEKEIKNILKNADTATAVYATEGNVSELVTNALRATKKTDLHFVAFDAGNKQTRSLENGVIDGLIVQNPFAIGYATVVACVRVSLGLGNESYVNTGYVWVTKENIDDVDIKKMLY